MKRLLVVDDEERIRLLIRKYAEFEDFEVKEAKDGMEAVACCRREDFDFIIMDVMMPELDGFSASKEIRKSKDVPILLLSARGEEYDKLHGFELGVDDYVVKPFSAKELMARVHAILSRTTRQNTPPKRVETPPREVLTFEGLVIDFTGRVVMVDGVRANLAPKEYDLLFYLVRNRGIALSREKLITEVWGYDFYGDDRTLDTHVKLLRGNLGEYRKFIVTLRGMGYRFEA